VKICCASLEIYFKDNRSLLIVFLDKKQRAEASQRLSNIANGNVLPSTPGLLRTPNFGKPTNES